MYGNIAIGCKIETHGNSTTLFDTIKAPDMIHSCSLLINVISFRPHSHRMQSLNFAVSVENLDDGTICPACPKVI